LAPPDARRAPRAGGTLLTVIAPFVNIQFLGSSLTFMMVRAAAPPVGDGLRPGALWPGAAARLRAQRRAAQVYVWGRRHQYVNLSFLGIFNFTAPYLPWVLLAFSVVLRSSPVVDLLGMVAGAARPCTAATAAAAQFRRARFRSALCGLECRLGMPSLAQQRRDRQPLARCGLRGHGLAEGACGHARQAAIALTLTLCATGHCYYFLEDVYPRITGRRPLRTPALLALLFPADDSIRPVAAPPRPPPPLVPGFADVGAAGEGPAGGGAGGGGDGAGPAAANGVAGAAGGDLDPARAGARPDCESACALARLGVRRVSLLPMYPACRVWQQMCAFLIPTCCASRRLTPFSVGPLAGRGRLIPIN
jgi:hypothetical protein